MVIAVVAIVVVVVVLAFGAFRTSRDRARADARLTGESIVVKTSGPRAIVNVDVGGAEDDPAVKRLIDDLARRTFGMLTSIDQLEFRGRDGVVLGIRSRQQIVVPRTLDTPQQLLEPRARLTGGSLVPEAERPDRAHPHFEAPDVQSRSLARRFALPPEVLARLHGVDEDDPRALVAAILGLEPEPVMRVGSTAVIVLNEGLGEPVPASALNHAFHLFERSGSKRGLVVTAGHLSRNDVRRREALAPMLQHVGPDGVQRMADAVALGADPFHFALPTQLTVLP